MTPGLAAESAGYLKAKAAQGPWLGAERERELLVRAQGGDRRALSELVESHMRLVAQIAGRYEREGLSAQDLANEGVIGLIEAISRFDLSHSSRLSTYAGWWIRARIREYAFENRRIVPVPSTRSARLARMQLRGAERRLEQRLGRRATHEEIASEIGVSETDVATVEAALWLHDISLSPSPEGYAFEVSDEQSGPEQEVAAQEARTMLHRALGAALDSLSERDRKIVREQLLDEERNMAEVARTLGVSRQRVCQVFTRVRKRLERDLRRVAC